MGQKIQGKEGKMEPSFWRAKEDFLRAVALDQWENWEREEAEALSSKEACHEEPARKSILPWRAFVEYAGWIGEGEEFKP